MRTDNDRSPPSAGHGQDERLSPLAGRAGKIVNFRWDPAGWWASDRGWEQLVAHPADFEFPENYLAPTRFLSIYTRHQGAETYYLYERGGNLAYDYGARGNASTQQVILAEGRHDPGPADAGTQLVEFGRFALIMNGADAPLKFFGQNFTTPFGFPLPPPPPAIAGVDPLIGSDILNDDQGIAAGTVFMGYLPGQDPPGPPFLGTAEEERSSYAYRIAPVSDTGSEGPMSAEVVVEWEPAASILQLLTFAVWFSGVPVGADNIVAWRIYRTKNLGNQAGLTDRTLYFVAEVPNGQTSWVDTLADSRLTILAPSALDSVPLPPGLRFGAAFDGRLWLGGGPSSPSRIWYSAPGRPEQFGAFSYFDLGAGSGDITQIIAHEGELYVFRERGIDLVRITEQLAYQAVALSSTTGTTASNTVKVVPGFGLVFLARDGVYVVNRQGVRHVSKELAPEWRRIGVGSLARATATWSRREGEYWVQYPADGSPENTRGAVLHTEIATLEAPVWSLRHVPPSDGSSVWRTIVTCLATDPDGWVIFGTSPINTTTGDFPGALDMAAISVDDELEGMGLQVWSARPAAGTTFTVTSKPEGFVTSQADAEPIEAIWQSPWIQYDRKGIPLHVEIIALNTGRPDLTFEYAINGRGEWTEVEQDVELQPDSTARRPSNDHVYAAEATALRLGYLSTWGESKWREDRVIRARWDISVAERSVQSFAWRIRTRDFLGLIAYRVLANGTTIATQSQLGAA